MDVASPDRTGHDGKWYAYDSHVAMVADLSAGGPPILMTHMVYIYVYTFADSRHRTEECPWSLAARSLDLSAPDLEYEIRSAGREHARTPTRIASGPSACGR